MPPIQITHGKLDGLARTLRGASKQAILITRRILVIGMGQIQAAVMYGSFFDDPTGELQGALWVGKGTLNGDNVSVSAGWAHQYGPVKEFGVTPAKQGGWPIFPKYARALRFNVGGVIVYSKGHWHPWTEDQMAPHWGPTLEELWPWITKQLDAVPTSAVVRGAQGA